MTPCDSPYLHFLQHHEYPRTLRSYKIGAFPDAIVWRDGKKLLDFSSNDYLGLAKHPFLVARSHEFAKRFGVGASSSRLVRGNLTLYEPLEQQLAKSLRKESALILGPGFETNASILHALLDP